jgi:hypothetical protein
VSTLELDDRTKDWLAKVISGHSTSVIDALAHSIMSQDTYKDAAAAIERNYEELEWLLELSDKAGVPRPDVAHRMKNIERMARRVSAHLAQLNQSTSAPTPEETDA